MVQPNIVNFNEFTHGPRVNEGDYQQWGVAAYSMDLEWDLHSSLKSHQMDKNQSWVRRLVLRSITPLS